MVQTMPVFLSVALMSFAYLGHGARARYRPSMHNARVAKFVPAGGVQPISGPLQQATMWSGAQAAPPKVWNLQPRLVVPASASPHRTGQRCQCPVMKDWSRRDTIADREGGAQKLGAAAVGLTGDVAVKFTQGEKILETMATVGQPLSSVAAQAGQVIRYKCRKGECGTCAVRVDGKWVRTCIAKVPQMPPGVAYEISVRKSMAKSKKSSRFFSIRSFFAGAKNNLLGMVGFVKEGISRNEKSKFVDRIDSEAEVLRKVKERKQAKEAAAKALGMSVEEYNKHLRESKVEMPVHWKTASELASSHKAIYEELVKR